MLLTLEGNEEGGLGEAETNKTSFNVRMKLMVKNSIVNLQELQFGSSLFPINSLII